MRRGIAVLAGLTLAACDSAAGAPDTATEHSIDPETGEVRITIPHEDGTATLRSGARLPVTLPAGLTLVPGARVLGNSQVTRADGGAKTLVTFEADAPAEAVIAHTRNEAKAAGFAVTLDETAGDTRLLIAERKGTIISATATGGTPATGQLAVDARPPG